jgi:hypothetical protein
MNVKLLLLTGLLCASSYNYPSLAMTAQLPAYDTVTLILDDQHTYQIPAEMASMLGILQIAGYDANNYAYSLQGSNLEPAILEIFADILRAAYILPKRNPELRAIGAGEKYLNAITQALQLNVRITAESLFAWSDYLNFPLGIYLAGNMLLQRPLPSGTTFPDITKVHELLQYIGIFVEENGLSQDSYKVFVKFISLSSVAAKAGSTFFSDVAFKNLEYSIRDYLDFKPKAIKIETIKIEEPKRDLNIEGLSIDLSNLHLVSLEGLNDIPGIERAIKLYLDGNFLTVLGKKEFAVAPNLFALNLGNNRLQEIDEQAFWGLDNLDTLGLVDNQLTFIHPATFQNNTRIGLINLAKNQLHLFHPATFRKLYYLKTLYLNQNFIVDIDTRIFNDLHQAVIQLQGNHLSKEAKEAIIQWNQENARERIEVSSEYKIFWMRPFIEFDRYEAPAPKMIAEPVEEQAPH